MKKQDNPRIAHLAVKVEDAEAAADFYKELFGFTEVSRHRDGDHVSLHLTDGHLDLALVQYDTSDSMMGNQAGPGPCIHHFGRRPSRHMAARPSATRPTPTKRCSNSAFPAAAGSPRSPLLDSIPENRGTDDLPDRLHWYP
jgi:catechol 2,3-dioxygenase-like lactoylglutathione lyase family enzyme